MLMNLATNASRWKMTLEPFCIRCSYSAASAATSIFCCSSSDLIKAATNPLMMTPAGMQCVISSYNRPRTSSSRGGDCSSKIRLAVSCRYSSQSAMGTCWSGRRWAPPCTLAASSIRMARRRLRLLRAAIRVASSGGKPMCSFFATVFSVLTMSSMVGAATRTPRHRDRIAPITLLDELQHRMYLQLDMYFSMIRRSACCASFVSLSASEITTTLKPRACPKSITCDCATSFSISRTTV
mmetsp:Transcript_15236/g.39171  ORF Transcript_15236/g.39171 Transcript_15236/m.39171 type:complete len:239 (-) Transcript_15236:355-1071(-)